MERRGAALLLGTLLACSAIPAFAAPSPTGPRGDRLEETLAIVEDLLQRFEETAASHHVLLTGPPAAQRTAALRLVSLARACLTEDRAAATRYLGWAASFPGGWWYGLVLSREHYVVVVDALDKVASECRETCPDAVAPGLDFETPDGNRRPYIQPNQITANGSGGYDVLLDFVHYPPERFEVSVRADSLPVAMGRIEPGATLLRVPASMGTYEITARLSRGESVHRYRAPAIVCKREGLLVNGERKPLKLAQLQGVLDRDASQGIAVVDHLKGLGFNAALVSEPPEWLVAAAEERQFGLVVELPPESGACSHCPAEQVIADFQVSLAVRIRRYVESPAVWVWAAAEDSSDADAHAEMAAPAFRHFDPYERPVLFMKDTQLAAAHDLSVVELEEGAVEEATLARHKERAHRRDVALLIDLRGHPGADALWQQAEPLGYAGAILESINVDTWTPPAP